jgi:hypothetical protein
MVTFTVVPPFSGFTDKRRNRSFLFSLKQFTPRLGKPIRFVKLRYRYCGDLIAIAKYCGLFFNRQDECLDSGVSALHRKWRKGAHLSAASVIVGLPGDYP